MVKQLLVCDLDNTMYDWVAYFVPAFYAMVDEVVRITGCDREVLLDDFRTVHQRYHDSEHPFAVLETNTVKSLFRDCAPAEIARQLDSAFHAFNSTRRDLLRLYPGVMEGLDALRASNVRLVAHTESRLFAVVDRLTRLDLVEYFEHIYCRERMPSLHPDPEVADAKLRAFPMSKVVELSHHQRKPDPDVLNEICVRNGVTRDACAYVGDSLARDMLMARNAGITAVWAKYGSAHSTDLYQSLVRVTHWTPEDVAREVQLKKLAAGLSPDFTLHNSFYEVIDILNEDPMSLTGRLADG